MFKPAEGSLSALCLSPAGQTPHLEMHPSMFMAVGCQLSSDLQRQQVVARDVTHEVAAYGV
jgi:hypothetical protein